MLVWEGMKQAIPTKGPHAVRHDCPVELTALVLCKAAVPHIFRDLATGPKTFTELRTTIVTDGASSSKTLAARLKSLEADGYIVRSELGGYLRRIEYELSEKGRSLVPAVEAMKDFGESWLQNEDCSSVPSS